MTTPVIIVACLIFLAMLAPAVYLSFQEARADAAHTEPAWATPSAKGYFPIITFMMATTLLGAAAFVVRRWTHVNLEHRIHYVFMMLFIPLPWLAILRKQRASEVVIAAYLTLMFMLSALTW